MVDRDPSIPPKKTKNGHDTSATLTTQYHFVFQRAYEYPSGSASSLVSPWYPPSFLAAFRRSGLRTPAPGTTPPHLPGLPWSSHRPPPCRPGCSHLFTITPSVADQGPTRFNSAEQAHGVYACSGRGQGRKRKSTFTGGYKPRRRAQRSQDRDAPRQHKPTKKRRSHSSRHLPHVPAALSLVAASTRPRHRSLSRSENASQSDLSRLAWHEHATARTPW